MSECVSLTGRDGNGEFSASAHARARKALDNRLPGSQDLANEFLCFPLGGRAMPLSVGSASALESESSFGAGSNFRVELPRLDAVDSSTVVAATQIKAWISSDLIPDAVERWNGAYAASARASSLLNVLKGHRDAKTYPGNINKALQPFTLPCDSTLLESTNREAQIRVNEAIEAARKCTLNEGILLRELEVEAANLVLSDEWVSNHLLDEWLLKLDDLIKGSPKLTRTSVTPLFTAALEDLDAYISGQIFEKRRLEEAASAKKLARDIAAADAKMDVDIISTEATMAEKIEEKIEAALQRRQKQMQQLEKAKLNQQQQTTTTKTQQPPQQKKGGTSQPSAPKPLPPSSNHPLPPQSQSRGSGRGNSSRGSRSTTYFRGRGRGGAKRDLSNPAPAPQATKKARHA